MDEPKPIPIIKKSEFAKSTLNQLRQNLVNAEIDVIFYKNNELVVNGQQFQENQKRLIETVAKQRQAAKLLKACEEELAFCLKEEKLEEEEAKKQKIAA